MKAVPLEGRTKLNPSLDPRDVAHKAMGLQGRLNQFGVPGVVFKIQNAQRRHGFLRALPGGGSLIIAQNIPSSLTALTNS